MRLPYNHKGIVRGLLGYKGSGVSDAANGSSQHIYTLGSEIQSERRLLMRKAHPKVPRNVRHLLVGTLGSHFLLSLRGRKP